MTDVKIDPMVVAQNPAAYTEAQRAEAIRMIEKDTAEVVTVLQTQETIDVVEDENKKTLSRLEEIRKKIQES